MFGRKIVISIITLLLSISAFAQTQNDEFFAAARKGDATAVKAFLDKGTNVNAKTQYGATALSYACDKGHVEVVKLLLERGADPDVKDTFYGATPMSWAAPKGFVEIVMLLIEKGAKDKGTALSLGVEKGSVPLVNLVLEKGGVAPETLTKALEKADTAKHLEMTDLLQKAGAKPFQKISAELLKSYEGFYKNEQLGDFNFLVKEGKLTAKFNTQSWLTLGAINPNTFTVLEFDGIILIFNSQADKVMSVTLKQNGGVWEFKRIEQK